MIRIMTRSSIDLSLLMSPVQHDSQRHRSVSVVGICSSTELSADNSICSSIDLSTLTVFAAVSIYQRYRYLQYCSSTDLFVDNTIRSNTDPPSLTIFAAA